MTKSRNNKTKPKVEVEYEFPYKALHDYVIIELAERKLDSSLIIPEGVTLGERSAIIRAVGEAVPEGKLEVGMHIIYAQWRKCQDVPDPYGKGSGKRIFKLVQWEDIACEFINKDVSAMYSPEPVQEMPNIAKARMRPSIIKPQ